MSESSDSTDEEERQRLREAVVTDVGGYVYPSNGGVVISTSAKEPAKARLEFYEKYKNFGDTDVVQPEFMMTLPPASNYRAEDVSDGEERHPFGTTPEFRAFKRRKLAKYLDSILDFTDSPRDSSAVLKGPPLGDCPLFNGCPEDSDTILESSATALPSRLTNGYDSSSTDSSENEKIAQAAVSYEFLFGIPVLPGAKLQYCKHPPDYSESASVEEKCCQKKKKRKMKKKEKHHLEGGLKEEMCALDSSDEASQVDCGNTSHGKKRRRKRKDSSKPVFSQTSDATSDEAAMHTADFPKKKEKKKSRKGNSEDAGFSYSCGFGDVKGQSDYKKKKKKRKGVGCVKEVCELGPHQVQNGGVHSIGREKVVVKSCTLGKDL